MLFEARRSRANERALRAAGAIEPADDVYAAMQIAYPACFLAMVLEAWVRGRAFGVAALAGGLVFVGAKALKYWAIATLGERWTFRVLVPPGSERTLAVLIASFGIPTTSPCVGELAGFALLARAPVAGALASRGLRGAAAAAHPRRGARARFAITIESAARSTRWFGDSAAIPCDERSRLAGAGARPRGRGDRSDAAASRSVSAAAASPRAARTAPRLPRWRSSRSASRSIGAPGRWPMRRGSLAATSRRVYRPLERRRAGGRASARWRLACGRGRWVSAPSRAVSALSAAAAHGLGAGSRRPAVLHLAFRVGVSQAAAAIRGRSSARTCSTRIQLTLTYSDSMLLPALTTVPFLAVGHASGRWPTTW